MIRGKNKLFRLKIVSISLLIIILGGMIFWLLLSNKDDKDTDIITTENLVDAGQVNVESACKLENGVPTYVFTISESLGSNTTYEIFDDAVSLERGGVFGNDSFQWVYDKPSIYVSLNDGDRKLYTSVACTESGENKSVKEE